MRSPTQEKAPLYLAVIAVLSLTAAPVTADDTTWQGGTGNWNVGGNWDTNTVPGSADDVFIDGGKTGTDSVVNVNVSSAAQNLTIDLGDTVDINNGQTLSIHGATILNDGEIGITSTGGFTTLSIQGDTTLTGSGAVQMSNQANNRIIGVTGSTLTHAADHSISGSGSIGGTVIGLDNAGVIEAVGSEGLTLNLRTTNDVTRRNTGTLSAASGGTLSITQSEIDNASGNIVAQTGGTVNITGGSTRILGGTLTGGGDVNLGGSATLANVQNDADITIANNQTGQIEGAITNTGTIALESTGGFTTLSIEGDTTLTGSGAVQMSNQANNRIIGITGSTLTHAADHSISGSGSIGGTVIGLDNAGVIEAVGSEGLTLNLRATNDVTRRNTGTLSAASGGTLSITQSEIDNASGNIVAQTGGTVNITGGSTRILGGTLTGGGDVNLGGSATLANVPE